MKPTTYINWDGLKDIPFFYCDTKEDEENKDFDIYYQGRLVLHDYNHCGHYLYTAAVLFSRIKNTNLPVPMNLSTGCQTATIHISSRAVTMYQVDRNRDSV